MQYNIGRSISAGSICKTISSTLPARIVESSCKVCVIKCLINKMNLFVATCVFCTHNALLILASGSALRGSCSLHRISR